MAEEIDDNEFFHQDFTTASEWEIFNARLEEIFHEWKLPFVETRKPLEPNQLFYTEWDTKSEILFFADVELRVKRYRAFIAPPSDDEECDDITKKKECQAHVDLMSLANNFSIVDAKSEKIHPLAVWYGLRDFVVIEPTGNPIVSESQYRVLLSSACMTVAESNTEIPVFIRVMQHDLNVYLGVNETTSMRTNFDIVALDTIPPTCKYLSGLLNIFKGKIGVHYMEPTTVSVRLSFSLTDFLSSTYCPQKRCTFITESSDDEPSGSDVETSVAFRLPYGVTLDPVNELILHCTWPNVSEYVLVDSPAYSDLNPLIAPRWSIRANFRENPIYLLTEICIEYLKLCENGASLGSILGSAYAFNQFMEGDNPLDLLTESRIPSIKSLLSTRGGSKATAENKSTKSSNVSDSPIGDDDLMNMLYFMFPDAQENSVHKYCVGETDFDPLKVKSACQDSLVFRLSLLLAICNTEYGGIPAVAHLWAEFAQEMRYRVERCFPIPG